jgi:hypothetical protein
MRTSVLAVVLTACGFTAFMLAWLLGLLPDRLARALDRTVLREVAPGGFQDIRSWGMG